MKFSMAAGLSLGHWLVPTPSESREGPLVLNCVEEVRRME